jgi:hypothetical protein
VAAAVVGVWLGVVERDGDGDSLVAEAEGELLASADGDEGADGGRIDVGPLVEGAEGALLVGAFGRLSRTSWGADSFRVGVS